MDAGGVTLVPDSAVGLVVALTVSVHPTPWEWLADCCCCCCCCCCCVHPPSCVCASRIAPRSQYNLIELNIRRVKGHFYLSCCCCCCCCCCYRVLRGPVGFCVHSRKAHFSPKHFKTALGSSTGAGLMDWGTSVQGLQCWLRGPWAHGRGRRRRGGQSLRGWSGGAHRTGQEG